MAEQLLWDHFDWWDEVKHMDSLWDDRRSTFADLLKDLKLANAPSVQQFVQQEIDYTRPGFYQLPDELVALIASHVDLKDIPNFLQTQQRVLRIAKRCNLDKPAYKKIVLNFKNGRSAGKQLICTLQGTLTTTERVFPGQYRAVGQPLVDFLTMRVRFTDSLEITKTAKYWQLNNVTAEYLIAIRNLIGKLILPTPLIVHLLPEYFVTFCKNFRRIDFQKTVIVDYLICDDVLCKIVESNVVDQYLPTSFPSSTLNVSDRLLESIASARRFSQFDFEHCKTSFTIRGIRQFVENITKTKNRFQIHFGEIPAYEKDSALLWLQDVVINHNLPYRMENSEDHFGVYCNFSFAKFDVRQDLA